MDWKLVIILVIAGMLAIRGFMTDGIFGGMWLMGMLIMGFGAGRLVSKIVAQRRK